MNAQNAEFPAVALVDPTACARYWADAAWRAVATLDLLRRRANNMREHEAKGMPPLLHFEGEQVADARAFDPPCNYRLLRITSCPHHMERHVKAGMSPVIVVEPRAGHGPGIGGFRRDSEVGMAMLEGHPVYFVVFDPEPVDGQTVGAVVGALARFFEIVARLHHGQRPIVYGNCQGGWAVVLALSHCNREVALAVLNGSPLSYWAGAADLNPMRLSGGLSGGVWPAHFAADLGNGKFDGAWLVQGFENLRPEGVWSKYDQVFADPDGQPERFLEFERWWSGFYKLGREEILTIVRDLFIGNRVEKGEVEVDCCCRADLARIRTPLVIFCSRGDNITPPAQALGWLKTVFGSTEALVQTRQRIVFLQHDHVGHLGIFVSADIARREHRAILHHAQAIQALAPGLYEMKLEPLAEDGGAPAAGFEPRRIEDLPFEPRPEAFERVDEVSRELETVYARWVSPAVRLFGNEFTAKWLELWHPMRSSRLVWSEHCVPATAALPLWLVGLQLLGTRDPDRSANAWYMAERGAARATAEAIESWRHLRDRTAEWLFQSLYGSSAAAAARPAGADDPSPPTKPDDCGGSDDQDCRCEKAQTAPPARPRRRGALSSHRGQPGQRQAMQPQPATKQE